jgi:hypothetical protein
MDHLLVYFFLCFFFPCIGLIGYFGMRDMDKKAAEESESQQ